MNRDDMKRIIGMLKGAFVEFNPPDLTATIDAYYAGLLDLSTLDVQLAANECIKRNKFFPRVSELREMAEMQKKSLPLSWYPYRRQAVEEYEKDNPDWLTIANRMRLDGYDCAASALELRASGQYSDGMAFLCEMLDKVEVTVCNLDTAFCPFYVHF